MKIVDFVVYVTLLGLCLASTCVSGNPTGVVEAPFQRRGHGQSASKESHKSAESQLQQYMEKLELSESNRKGSSSSSRGRDRPGTSSRHPDNIDGKLRALSTPSSPEPEPIVHYDIFRGNMMKEYGKGNDLAHWKEATRLFTYNPEYETMMQRFMNEESGEHPNFQTHKEEFAKRRQTYLENVSYYDFREKMNDGPHNALSHAEWVQETYDSIPDKDKQHFHAFLDRYFNDEEAHLEHIPNKGKCRKMAMHMDMYMKHMPPHLAKKRE